jgi:cytochrome c oxidase cbb3-type subunit 4
LTFDQIVEVLRSLWGLWVMIFFSGIVLWAYWPKNKGTIESHADIPLKDDDNEER